MRLDALHFLANRNDLADVHRVFGQGPLLQQLPQTHLVQGVINRFVKLVSDLGVVPMSMPNENVTLNVQ